MAELKVSWEQYHAAQMALKKSKRAWKNPEAKKVFRAMQARQKRGW